MLATNRYNVLQSYHLFCAGLLTLIVNLGFGQTKITTNFENPTSRLRDELNKYAALKEEEAVNQVGQAFSVDNRWSKSFDDVSLNENLSTKGLDTAEIINEAGAYSNSLQLDSLKINNMSNRLDSLRSFGEYVSIDSTLLNVDSVVLDSIYLGQFQIDTMYDSTLINSVKLDSSSFTIGIDSAMVESQVRERLDTLGLPNQMEYDVIANFRNEEFLGEYENYFDNYAPLVDKANASIQRYKKFENFKSGFKDFLNNKLNPSDTSMEFKRVEFGGFMDFNDLPNQIVISPGVQLNITNRISVGTYLQSIIKFDPIDYYFGASRVFFQYQYRKYFAYIEDQIGQPLSDNEVLSEDTDGLSFGIGRLIAINKAKLKVILLYTPNSNKNLSVTYGIMF